VQLSQFHRLSHYGHQSSLLSSSSSHQFHHHHHPMWTPSFSFHFTAFSTVKRLYRRIKYLFVKKPTPTLPYYMPTNTRDSSSSSHTILTFLSRDDTNLYSDNSHRSSPDYSNGSSVSANLLNRISYYAKRITTTKTSND